jgi:hypothetical protein
MYANLERWPATPSEGDNERAERAPRIVLMGSRRSGKTSMARVVFGKMSPHETLFVPSTAQPTLRLVANSDLVHFSIFDVPGATQRLFAMPRRLDALDVAVRESTRLVSERSQCCDDVRSTQAIGT